MPKERTYTKAGAVEVQWAKDGQLVCLVVTEQPEESAMYQFTDAEALQRVIRHLKRAGRAAFGTQTRHPR